MFRIPTLRRLAAVAILAGGACSTAADPEPPATLPPDASAVLEAAALVMGTVDTVAFTIERSGAPVHIDPLDLVVFNKATGRFAAPTSADALVTVQVGGFNTEIGAIAFDGKTWLSDPISGNFSLAPGGYAFDPATLFDPDEGWRPLLASGLSDVEWVGLETGEQGDRYHLRGIADPDRLEVITAGLVRDETVVLDLWLDTATGAVREVEFTTSRNGEPSMWSLSFSAYGDPVDVTPPPETGG